MTLSGRLTGSTQRGGLRFIIEPRKGRCRRQAKLSNQRPREGGGGRFRPNRLDTYVFSRLRCKPTATAVAAALRTGAGVARRRAHADQQEPMSDTSTSTTTTVEQPAEQLPFSKNRQHRPNVLTPGGRVLGGGQDTRDTRKRREGVATAGLRPPVLPCPGCPTPNQNYRVACAQVRAHPRLWKDRVWTRDTQDTDSSLPYSRGRSALAASRVSSPRPPRGQDTPGHSAAKQGVFAR
jgi:hypothetical protein